MDRSAPAMAMACWVRCSGSDGGREVIEKAVADLMDLWRYLRRRMVPVRGALEISMRMSSAPVRSGRFCTRSRRSGVRKRRERNLGLSLDAVLPWMRWLSRSLSPLCDVTVER